MWEKLTARQAMEVAAHEALVREAYRDSVGKLTWCVGMTNATGHRVERYIDNPASVQHCMNVFAWALDNYADGVREAFKGHHLTESEFAAALSFHWNTGAIKRASWVKKWKAGDKTGARKAFMNWTSPPEITDRRRQERDLFFKGEWSGDGTMIEYTRVHKGSLSPVWGSAERIDVDAELKKALGKPEKPVVDQKPDPEAAVEAPTLSPGKDAPAEPVQPPKPAPRPEPHPESKTPSQEPDMAQPQIDLTEEQFRRAFELFRNPPNSKPSPIDQVSKVVGAVKGNTFGNGITGALTTILLASDATWDIVPDAFTEAPVVASFILVGNWAISSLTGAWSTYWARENAKA